MVYPVPAGYTAEPPWYHILSRPARQIHRPDKPPQSIRNRSDRPNRYRYFQLKGKFIIHEFAKKGNTISVGNTLTCNYSAFGFIVTEYGH